MYSVLFQSQRTMEFYEPFRPIFMPLIRSGGMGICQWMEAGTTVDTVIPGIYDLVSDKEEWRAVIMCMNEPEDQKAFPSRPENPYDFIENSSPEPVTKESRIPLVRLTQMLGGVPAPAMHFLPQLVQEKDKQSRMIYMPNVREEDQRAYEELKKKYHFHGKLPSEIILVCPRDRQETHGENIEEVWKDRIMADTSDFWRRNGYPARCRFTVFDITGEGDVRKTEELFNLWMTVMILASNDIDPSTLQAYRLYRIAVEFDHKKMEASFQEAAGRVQRARRSIEKSIRRELEKRLGEDAALPDYELKAPVVLKLPERNQIFSERGRFGLTAKNQAADLEILRDMKDQAEKGLDGLGNCAERALNQTAQRIRQCREYQEEEVYPLNPYQLEDMEEKLEREYRNIFELRKELPGLRENSREELERLGRNIREVLAERTTRNQAAGALAAVSALFALSVSPAVIAGLRAGSVSVLTACGFVAVGIAAFAGAEFLCLLSQKAKLQLTVHAFHRFMNSAATAVTEDGQLFSRYLSEIASYMHGSSFLSVLRRRESAGEEEFSGRKLHIAALSAFYSNLKEWCRAYHLQLYFDSAAMGEELTVDTELPPEMNPMYTFASEEKYLAEVNNTGDTIEAPFDFIRKLKIIREELSDDTK